MNLMYIGKSPSLVSKVSVFLMKGTWEEFWGHVPGLVIEVTAGGWWEQECSRTGFVGQWTKDIREYFVGGQNACVSVLSWSEPAITNGDPHSRYFC